MTSSKRCMGEKNQVIRRFVEAQSVFAVLGGVYFAHQQLWPLVVAVFIALGLQWIQLYFMSRPYRVANMRQWVSGMVFGIFLKYLVFVIATLLFLKSYSLHLTNASYSKEAVVALCILIGVYCAPFWYSGVRLSKFKAQKPAVAS